MEYVSIEINNPKISKRTVFDLPQTDKYYLSVSIVLDGLLYFIDSFIMHLV